MGAPGVNHALPGGLTWWKPDVNLGLLGVKLGLHYVNVGLHDVNQTVEKRYIWGEGQGGDI